MKDIIIVGAGGLGREVLQWIKDINKVKKQWNILGFINDEPHALEGFECDYSIIGTIKEWIPSANQVFACAIADPNGKELVTNLLKERGAVFTPVIHPTAMVSDFSPIGEGMIMYPGSGISVNVKIGKFVTLLYSGVGHNAEIGDYSTISSYCDIAGGAIIEDKVFIGSHTTLIPKKRVGSGAYVGAGSVVVSHVKEGSKVMGNPAMKMDF